MQILQPQALSILVPEARCLLDSQQGNYRSLKLKTGFINNNLKIASNNCFNINKFDLGNIWLVYKQTYKDDIGGK